MEASTMLQFSYEPTLRVISNIISSLLVYGFTYWTLSNILSPQAHVGAVLNGRASLLLLIPATIRVPGSQALTGEREKK